MPSGHRHHPAKTASEKRQPHCAFEDLDHAVLQEPLHLGGGAGIRQILTCVQSGSREVKDLILNECSLIYECKLCQALFRSLANFMYHKRCYCKKHVCEKMVLFRDFDPEEPAEEPVLVHPEAPEEPVPEKQPESPPPPPVDLLPKMMPCTVELVKADVPDHIPFPESSPESPPESAPETGSAPEEKAPKRTPKQRAAESASKQKAAESALKQKAAESAPKQKAAESIPKQKAAESALKQKASEITAKQKAAESTVKQKASESTARLKVAESTAKLTAAESTAKLKMAESIAKLKAAEITAKQKAAESAPKQKVADSAPKQKVKVSIPETTPAVTDIVPETSVVTEDARDTTSAITEDVPKTPSTMEEDTPETSSMSPETPPAVPKRPSAKEPQQQGASKGKNKPPAEKRAAESSKFMFSMMSRRTRDKSSQQISNAHKLPVESSSDEEPPPKIIKMAAEDSENEKPASTSEAATPSPTKSDTRETSETPIKCTIAKSISNFPKFFLKPIACKSNSMLKSSDRKKAEDLAIKNLQNFPIQTKLDRNKLVIVLKKKEAGSPEAKLSEKQRSESQKLNEFHLTRRKRLMSRSDCNVHELKCLVCKTQFMSLKTLYFHMLSLHSKKRLYYPCPFCKTLFVQMYGVTRHLISIHSKTKEQINKLRDVIKKKSVWKRVDDADAEEKPRQELGIESYPLKPHEEPVEPGDRREHPDVRGTPGDQAQFEVSSTESSPTKTVIKIGKNSALHACSKCSRVFGRKSSQVSHEKFCIMNAIKVDTVVERSPSPPPTAPIRPEDIMPVIQREEEAPLAPSPTPENTRISARPKRAAEKLMHKDFVNSQTLKWRSANRIETNNKLVPKKTNSKGIEKKVLNIMDAENLSCTKCDKKFSSFSNLRRHIAIHVGWTRFKCKHCDYQAYNKSQCWAHVQKAHPSSNADIEKSIEHLSGDDSNDDKKSSVGEEEEEEEPVQKMKHTPDVPKSFPKSTVTKIKVPKKKNSGPVRSLTMGPVRSLSLGPVKSLTLPKKNTFAKKDLLETKRDSLDGKKENHESKMDGRKDARDGKKDAGRRDGSDGKKETKKFFWDGKKEAKSYISDGKRDVVEGKKDEDVRKEDHKKESQENPVRRRDSLEGKNEADAVPKACAPEYKKEINYKSMTTSNPTTIILSKRIPSSAVQSIVAISPGSVSPIRSSPRKSEQLKLPEIKQLPKLQGLVTRSGGPPIQLKLPVRSLEGDSEKTYARKDRLISEWFPKKDLNSNNARRESAPVIIGLVPASGSTGLAVRNKSPMAFDAAP